MSKHQAGPGPNWRVESSFLYSEEVWLLVLIVCVMSSLGKFGQMIERYYRRRSLTRKHGCLETRKYPHSTSTGQDLVDATQQELAAGTLLASQKARFDKYGPTFETLVKGQRTLHTIEPRNYQTIALTSFESFARGPVQGDLAKSVWGSGIMNSDGRAWAHSRALMRPTFQKDDIAQCVRFRPLVDRLLKELLSKRNETIDLFPLFRDYSYDSVTEFMFGESVLCQEPAFASAEGLEFLRAFEACSSNVGYSHLQSKQGSSKKDKAWKSNVKTMHAYIDKQVAKAMALRKGGQGKEQEKHSSRIGLLQEMVERTTDDEEDLRFQILQIILPAHESIGVLLSAVTYALAAYPKVWEALRKEVQSYNVDEPDDATIRSCVYLRHVLLETLRFWPFFAIDRRMCLRDTILPCGGGPDQSALILVTSGTIVSVDAYAMHRSKDLWGADAEEFKPERWATARPGWEYMGFGGGARTCPAQGLVLTEAGYVLFRIAKTFSALESKDDKPWTESISLGVRNKYGTKISLRV